MNELIWGGVVGLAVGLIIAYASYRWGRRQSDYEWERELVQREKEWRREEIQREKDRGDRDLVHWNVTDRRE